MPPDGPPWSVASCSRSPGSWCIFGGFSHGADKSERGRVPLGLASRGGPIRGSDASAWHGIAGPLLVGGSRRDEPRSCCNFHGGFRLGEVESTLGSRDQDGAGFRLRSGFYRQSIYLCSLRFFAARPLLGPWPSEPSHFGVSSSFDSHRRLISILSLPG